MPGLNLVLPLTEDEHEALAEIMVSGRYFSLDAAVRSAIGVLAGNLGVRLQPHQFNSARRKRQPPINFGDYLDETPEIGP